MGKIAAVLFLASALLAGPPVLSAQNILYEEYFTDGSTDLDWTSAWFDSAGTPLTPMNVENVPDNPSGDGWVGLVNGDTASLGGLGLAFAGDPDMTNYSIEAQIFVSPSTGYYNGVMAKIDTTGGLVRGYQLVANFYSPFAIERIRLRRYVSIPDSIEVLHDWEGSVIPGGPPVVDGWHKLEMRIEDYAIRCFWDDVELPDGPFYDFEYESGPFGIYTFNPFAYAQTFADDIVVKSTGTGIEDPAEDTDVPRAFALGQNYPNPFNPSTVIPVTISSTETGENRHVQLSIYDLRGREVRRLLDRSMSPGSYQIHWDGKDSSGGGLSSGVYLYKLRNGDRTISRKMIMAR